MIKELIKKYDIPIVRQIEGDTGHLSIINRVRSQKNAEGVVIHWPRSGQRIKLKSEWYCNIHSAKESIAFENNLVKIILVGQSDDLIAKLDTQADFVKEYEKKLWTNIHNELSLMHHYVKKLEGSRKDKALKINKNLSREKCSTAFYILNDVDNFNYVEYSKDYILKHISSRARLEQVRWLIGNENFYKNRIIEE